jgi:hypothetical protein
MKTDLSRLSKPEAAALDAIRSIFAYNPGVEFVGVGTAPITRTAVRALARRGLVELVDRDTPTRNGFTRQRVVRLAGAR